MSQVTIYFGVAPAVAPIVGGWLFVHTGWHSIFWFLALVGAILWITNFRLLPETLHPSHRQPFNVRHLMRGYWALGSSPKFLLLALASGVLVQRHVPVCAVCPSIFGRTSETRTHPIFLVLRSDDFWNHGGRLAAADASAGRIAPKRQIRHGFVIMFVVGIANVALNTVLAPHPAWALLPIAIFSFGWALIGARGHVAGAGPSARTPRDGIVAAGFRGLYREWGGGWRDFPPWSCTPHLGWPQRLC